MASSRKPDTAGLRIHNMALEDIGAHALQGGVEVDGVGQLGSINVRDGCGRNPCCSEVASRRATSSFTRSDAMIRCTIHVMRASICGVACGPAD